MELIDNFSSKCWTRGDYNTQTGFVAYQVASRAPVRDTAGHFHYALASDEGEMRRALLDGGGKKDPLHGIKNIEVKFSEDGIKIVGIIVEDECVLYSG